MELIRNIKRNMRNYSLLAAVFTFSFLLFPSLADASGLTRPANNLGLVGYWSFEDGRGSLVTDFSGNGYTGMLINSPTWINGRRGKAVRFSQSAGSYATTSFSAYVTSTSFWFKDDGASSGYAGIIGQGVVGGTKSFELRNAAGNCGGTPEPYYLTNSGGDTCLTGLVPDGQWKHVVLVASSSNTLVYLNGSLLTTVGFLPGAAVGYLRFGTANNEDRFADVILDEVRIYNRVLSATEVTALYNAGTAKLNTSQNNVAPESLVLWHTFDGGYLDTTTSNDRSGQGNNGTLTGASGAQNKPQPVNGKVGQALNFDGTDDYISVADNASLNITDYISICSWVYPDTWVGHNARIVQKGGDSAQYRFLSESGNFVFEVADKFLNTATLPSAGQWSHTCGVYDGATSKIYLNAAVIASTTATGTIATTTGPLYIGTKNSSAPASDVFEGKLDDLRIFNRALTAAEVERLYSSGAAKLNVSQVGSASSGLVLWHTFDGPYLSTTTSTDRSGNGNHATLSGSPTPLPNAGKIGQALNFDGSSSWANGGAGTTLDVENITLSAWIKTSSAAEADTRAIMGKDGAYAFGLNTGGPPRFTTNTSGGGVILDGPVSLADNNWHHQVATYDGEDMYLYVDGLVVASTSAQSGDLVNATGNSLIIGARANGNGGHKWLELMDDLRIYNRAFSAAEVLQLYNLGK